MKYSRLLLGLVVAIVALWIVVGEQMSGASADAVVNAPVVTLRTEVAGQLALQPRTLGTRVARGETIASVTDRLADNVRLNDLEMERAFAAAELDRLGQVIAASRTIEASLRERAERYRSERLAELRAQLTHARNRLQILEDEGLTGLDGNLLVALDEGASRLPAEPLREALVVEHARERVAQLEIEVRAAEAQVFLGDGYNDAPNAEQRMVELASEIAAHEARAAEVGARAAALDTRIDRERVRLNLLSGGEVRAPVDGIYWEVLEADGVTVQRGDPVLRLVDCGAVMVTLSVSEGVYNRLEVGQAATFRPEGEARAFAATVSRLAGSGAATVYERLAVAPSQEHLERYDVTLMVPGLSGSGGIGCAIGRTGRAFFDTRPLDWVRDLL